MAVYLAEMWVVYSVVHLVVMKVVCLVVMKAVYLVDHWEIQKADDLVDM